ncbi:hypothetical protein ACFQX7_37925 [Luedemannella flava]
MRSCGARVAVRRDWPDGTHDLFGWQAGAADLAASIRADRARWRRGPLRPTHSVVSLSGRDFVLHADRDRVPGAGLPGWRRRRGVGRTPAPGT